MSCTNIHFCKDCNNLTFIYVNEDKKLIHWCKICSKSEDYIGDGCIFSHDFSTFDRSKIINSNKYINQDITIPFIKNNPLIKCPNSECESLTSGDSLIKYVKHDYENMKYTYICNYCGQKWAN